MITRRRAGGMVAAVLLILMTGIGPAGAIEQPDIDDRVVEVEELEPGALLPQAAVSVRFSDAYDADPMGLVAYMSMTSLFTDGTEPWDVWICRSGTYPSLGLTPSGVVDALNASAPAYYAEISEGRYSPSFSARGELSTDTCGVNTSHTGLTPRIYVKDWSLLDQGGVAGLGGPGLIGQNGTALVYEGQQRRVEVTGDAVATTAYQFSPAGSITAHEIGHSLFWAHSGAAFDYDNSLDIMSAGWGGTHGFNLYSAGWIEPEQVALHHGADRTYRLGPVGYSGTRMIVVTTGEEGHFYVLSMRATTDPNLDANSAPVVPANGIEVYEVDQRPEACSGLPAASPCIGLLAEIQPYPPETALTYPYPHFHEAGETFEIEGVPVTVTAGGGDTLDVRVQGGLTGSGIFLDDDSSVFEGDIEWVAIVGITKGCNPPRGDFFCPGDTVTRGQMAAFLVRTLGLPPSSTDYFTDDDGTTFENDINALAASGITKGCSATSFCPGNTVTREQMAAFLNRAYALPATGTDFFGDDDGTTFENDINALAASGITKGCSATSFCGKDTVTREQMAAFLRRAESG